MQVVKKYLTKYKWLWKPLVFIQLYVVWIFTIRLLTLTFITYYTISPTSHFQDMNDALSSIELSLMGLSAFLFIFLLCNLNPLTSTRTQDVITREQIEKRFLPGFVHGAFFSGGMILAFVLSNAYRFLGYFIQFDEVPLELINVLLRTFALGTLTYCEEFIFRHKIEKELKGHLPDFAVISMVALLFCGVKLVQFDLGIMQVITLFLVSIALSFRFRTEEQFSKGAGFWAAILIVFHPLLSLPILGNDFSGILLLKHQSLLQATHRAAHQESMSSLNRFLTGGAGGPLSSFAFQLLLILDIGRSILMINKMKLISLTLKTKGL